MCQTEFSDTKRKGESTYSQTKRITKMKFNIPKKENGDVREVFQFISAYCEFLSTLTSARGCKTRVRAICNM